jgi:hypothetical protein
LQVSAFVAHYFDTSTSGMYPGGTRRHRHVTRFEVSAADAKVDSAIKVFKQTEVDAGKIKTYCEMTKTMDAAGDNEDAATDAKIDDYLQQLGPDFTTAWNTGQEMDENSPDAKAFGAALDELGSKCG